MKTYLVYFLVLPFLMTGCARKAITLKDNPEFFHQVLLSEIDRYSEMAESVNRPLRLEPVLQYRPRLIELSYPYTSDSRRNSSLRKMNHQCAFDAMPDTTRIERLVFPERIRKKLVFPQIQNYPIDSLSTILLSPVFETKEKGVYGFQVYQIFNIFNAGDFYTHNYYGEIERFRITEGVVEWLDCCGQVRCEVYPHYHQLFEGVPNCPPVADEKK